MLYLYLFNLRIGHVLAELIQLFRRLAGGIGRCWGGSQAKNPWALETFVARLAHQLHQLVVRVLLLRVVAFYGGGGGEYMLLRHRRRRPASSS